MLVSCLLILLMNKYIYNGPVMVFDRCVAGKFVAETVAPSKEKAKSNIIYQFKKNNNLVPSARVSILADNLILELIMDGGEIDGGSEYAEKD